MKSIRNNNLLFKEIVNDRRMLFDMSRKDIKSRFSGTYFGLLWGVFQPALTIFVYWAAFQFGFKSGDVGDYPFGIWFICGIVCWLYVSEAISMASNCFIEYSYLIKKVKFNVSILPLVKIFSSFFIHMFFVVVAIIISAFLGFFPSLKLLQLLYYMFATIMIIFAITLSTSSIMVFFRDLGQIINVFILIGMWGTPIAWDMSSFPLGVQNVLSKNPFYYLVEGYRDAILGRQWFWEKAELGMQYWCVTFCLLIVGCYAYTRLRPHFADSV